MWTSAAKRPWHDWRKPSPLPTGSAPWTRTGWSPWNQYWRTGKHSRPRTPKPSLSVAPSQPFEVAISVSFHGREKGLKRGARTFPRSPRGVSGFIPSLVRYGSYRSFKILQASQCNKNSVRIDNHLQGPTWTYCSTPAILPFLLFLQHYKFVPCVGSLRLLLSFSWIACLLGISPL